MRLSGSSSGDERKRESAFLSPRRERQGLSKVDADGRLASMYVQKG